MEGIAEKIAKRTVEALSKRYFLNLVKSAYLNHSSVQLKKIRKIAGYWYGVEGDNTPLHRKWVEWYVNFLCQAQIDLFRLGQDPCDLGNSLIGFEDLLIRCSTGDINSSIVYLMGFSDNCTYFDIYRKYIVPGTVVLDVGANLGIHTLVMSRCTGAHGKVLSFEALKWVYERLLHNLGLNAADNVLPRNVGIGDLPGWLRFDTRRGDFNIGKARISATGDTEIAVSTIDEQLRDLREPVSLIKIDIEGYEMKALWGARETLERHTPALVVEFNADSYSFAQFRSAIPFKAVFFQIPLSYHDQLREIDDSFRVTSDILIVPSSRFRREN